MSKSIDSKVLEYLRSVQGSTAWAMCGRFGGERVPVSQALQRLKRKGLVACSGTAYWQAVKP